MFKRNKIPADVQERFGFLRSNPVILPGNTPLMPRFKLGWGWRAAIHEMRKIKTLPAGTEIILNEVGFRDGRAWYNVNVKDSLVSGWINSVVFEGTCYGTN